MAVRHSTRFCNRTLGGAPQTPTCAVVFDLVEDERRRHGDRPAGRERSDANRPGHPVGATAKPRHPAVASEPPLPRGRVKTLRGACHGVYRNSRSKSDVTSPLPALHRIEA